MRSKVIINIFLTLILTTSAVVVSAQKKTNNPDDHFVGARIAAITDDRISIIAATGVEHLIAIEVGKTVVVANDKTASVSNLHEGDKVDVELDPANKVMFAKTIKLERTESEEARVRD